MVIDAHDLKYQSRYAKNATTQTYNRPGGLKSILIYYQQNRSFLQEVGIS